MSVNARDEKFELAELFGKPALFTNSRIDRDTMPEGFYCYDLRGSDYDPGKPVTVEKSVSVNFAGAVLMPESLDFKGKELRRVSGKLNFLGAERSLAKFCDDKGLTLAPDPRKHILRPASDDEVGLFYSMSDEKDVELATVGHLRQDFGSSGESFYTTWWKHNGGALNTAEFKSEFEEVINELRKCGPLKSLAKMSSFCYEHGEKIIGSNNSFGFITETENYRYALRLTPQRGDYNAYVYAFDKRQQEQNMVQQPDEGIKMGGMKFE